MTTFENRQVCLLFIVILVIGFLGMATAHANTTGELNNSTLEELKVLENQFSYDLYGMSFQELTESLRVGSDPLVDQSQRIGNVELRIQNYLLLQNKGGN